MAFCPNASSTLSVPTSTPRTQEAARAQRVSQVQCLEERLRNGIPTVTVAGIAAMLAQLETRQVLPNVGVFGRRGSGFPAYHDLSKWYLGWYNLTHPFLDDRSTAIYGPSQNTVFEQEASLRMLQAASGTPQLSQPPQLSAF